MGKGLLGTGVALGVRAGVGGDAAGVAVGGGGRKRLAFPS